MIQIENSTSFQNIIISAVRYALTRQTYIVNDTIDFVLDNYGILTEKTKNIIIKDVENAKIESDIDKVSWMLFLHQMRKLGE